MELRYSNRELERQCTQLRYMKKKLDEQRAKALRLRLNELRAAADMSDLLIVGGRWEPFTGDRNGQWSARLTKEATS